MDEDARVPQRLALRATEEQKGSRRGHETVDDGDNRDRIPIDVVETRKARARKIGKIAKPNQARARSLSPRVSEAYIFVKFWLKIKDFLKVSKEFFKNLVKTWKYFENSHIKIQ